MIGSAYATLERFLSFLQFLFRSKNLRPRFSLLCSRFFQSFVMFCLFLAKTRKSFVLLLDLIDIGCDLILDVKKFPQKSPENEVVLSRNQHGCD